MANKVVLKDRYVSSISKEEIEKYRKDSREVSDFSKHAIVVSDEDKKYIRENRASNQEKYKNKISNAGREL